MGSAAHGSMGGNMTEAAVFPKLTDCLGHPGNIHTSLSELGAGGQVG